MNKQQPQNETKTAVALRYSGEQDAAPRVIAKGKGYVAEEITRLAELHAIPTYQNKTLVSALMAVELDKEIPPELYSAVAEVLAYIYRLDQSLRIPKAGGPGLALPR